MTLISRGKEEPCGASKRVSLVIVKKVRPRVGRCCGGRHFIALRVGGDSFGNELVAWVEDRASDRFW
jgi:hypothetical protein